jgi:hypothetical protein
MPASSLTDLGATVKLSHIFCVLSLDITAFDMVVEAVHADHGQGPPMIEISVGL